MKTRKQMEAGSVYYIRSNAYWPDGYTPGPQETAPAVAGPFRDWFEASKAMDEMHADTGDNTLHITKEA